MSCPVPSPTRQLTWHMTVVEHQLTGVGASHTQFVQLRGSGESWCPLKPTVEKGCLNPHGTCKQFTGSKVGEWMGEWVGGQSKELYRVIFWTNSF